MGAPGGVPIRSWGQEWQPVACGSDSEARAARPGRGGSADDRPFLRSTTVLGPPRRDGNRKAVTYVLKLLFIIGMRGPVALS